ncbi:hypothetical protein [Deinococcus hopiensis]|uniref:hypothetical protein n=1 Tax=Deinococcus hopiensis TaxID=309885 RepID=UPI001FE86FD9|nr:hypothetical protein [Deinococcus hopiensis]
MREPDWWRQNAEDRGRYGAPKRELAARDFACVYGYNNATAPLIHELHARALAASAVEEVW